MINYVDADFEWFIQIFDYITLHGRMHVCSGVEKVSSLDLLKIRRASVAEGQMSVRIELRLVGLC